MVHNIRGNSRSMVQHFKGVQSTNFQNKNFYIKLEWHLSKPHTFQMDGDILISGSS